MTGKQVAELFTRYDVWVYVYSCYEALHTTGANYIVEDIDLYMPGNLLWLKAAAQNCTFPIHICI